MRIDVEIANLESVLINCQDHLAKSEMDEMQSELDRYRLAAKLWREYKAIPLGNISRKTKMDFQIEDRKFPVGTDEAKILSYFERKFHISVHELFDYNGPWKPTSNCTDCPCADCRRYRGARGKFNRWDSMPDLYSPTIPPKAPVIKTSTTPQCEIEIRVDTPFCIKTTLTEYDITRWMDECKNPETLRLLSRYAMYCIQSLENPVDDDFRSRA